MALINNEQPEEKLEELPDEIGTHLVPQPDEFASTVMLELNSLVTPLPVSLKVCFADDSPNLLCANFSASCQQQNCICSEPSSGWSRQLRVEEMECVDCFSSIRKSTIMPASAKLRRLFCREKIPSEQLVVTDNVSQRENLGLFGLLSGIHS